MKFSGCTVGQYDDKLLHLAPYHKEGGIAPDVPLDVGVSTLGKTVLTHLLSDLEDCQF